MGISLGAAYVLSLVSSRIAGIGSSLEKSNRMGQGLLSVPMKMEPERISLREEPEGKT